MERSILIIGLIQCIIFLLLHWQKQTKTIADKILLVWLLTFATHLFILLVGSFGIQTQEIEVIAKTIVLLHGPFLFLYTASIFHLETRLHYLFHFIPFLLMTLLGFILYSKARILWEDLNLIVKMTSILSYPILIVAWLSRKNNELRNQSSNNVVLEINWIRTLAYLLFFSFLSSILFVLANQFFHWNLDNNLDIVFYVLMITIMGYYGLKLIVVSNSSLIKTDTGIKAQKSYKHSPLDTDKIEKIAQEIIVFFSDTDMYLNPNFSISQLSKNLNVPKHHLSQVINKKMKTTFYDLVNSKRVAYAKRKITEHQNLRITLEALGYESGFNTKAAFYFHFKKATGKTPGQFKKQIRID